MKQFRAQLLTAASVVALTPMLAFAQIEGGSGEISTFIEDIIFFINDVIIPFIFAIALVVFLWGAFKFFILGGHEEEKRKEGRNLMLYAILGFVLMVSIFGIVNLIADGLGFSGEQIRNLPWAPEGPQ